MKKKKTNKQWPTIEKGIPIPYRKKPTGKNSKTADSFLAFLRSLEIGDSFLITNNDNCQLRGAKVLSSARATNINLASRAIAADTTRFWRVE